VAHTLLWRFRERWRVLLSSSGLCSEQNKPLHHGRDWGALQSHWNGVDLVFPPRSEACHLASVYISAGTQANELAIRVSLQLG
jgi:hypothetical protein